MDPTTRQVEILLRSGQIEHYPRPARLSKIDTIGAYLAIGALMGFAAGFMLCAYIGGA